MADPRLGSGLALLDAPDIDSVVESNRELAAQLLAAADLWLFVTTANRYADAVPWDLLHVAQARSTALAVVLNRVPPKAAPEVEVHLRDMLDNGGLADAKLFRVAETELENGLLPAREVQPIRSWLVSLASDSAARAEVVRTTLEGALDSLGPRVSTVADELDAQAAEGEDLRRDVDRIYAAARDEVADGLSGGALLRGEVLARWQEFVGTGELMRSLEARIGRLRDRLRAVLLARPEPALQVKAALSSNIEALVGAAADRAAERVVRTWESVPAGRHLLGETRGLDRSSPQLRSATAEQIREWQQHVMELVAAEGATKRTAARFLSFSVNGAAVALMIGVFAHTGGLSGGELAVAGGTATVSQKLLEALFGDHAVRLLTQDARLDLLARVNQLLDHEAARFLAVLERAGVSSDEGAKLRAAEHEVQTARR